MGDIKSWGHDTPSQRRMAELAKGKFVSAREKLLERFKTLVMLVEQDYQANQVIVIVAGQRFVDDADSFPSELLLANIMLAAEFAPPYWPDGTVGWADARYNLGNYTRDPLIPGVAWNDCGVIRISRGLAA